ncbi:DUF2478 domain-containing protein [Polycladidibacter hongkongensis]|uniref:DUF2478 domain-containing protein n=1 Tax=Polycladidibacter hongkongensis TaxID=1647556 RepID=UPI0008349387|nr:DUF2478 domain-containing protein [Pseudovibrio hongkongensis]
MLAVVCFGEEGGVDTLLKQCVEQLQQDGLVLHGVLQEEGVATECCGPMSLRQIRSGEARQIFQELGAGSRGCRLDFGALAAVCAQLEAGFDGTEDLVILNRFGKSESEGGGLRSVIEIAIAQETPVLIGVKETYRDAFLEYAGEFGEVLANDVSAVLAWCSAMRAKKAA